MQEVSIGTSIAVEVTKSQYIPDTNLYPYFIVALISTMIIILCRKEIWNVINQMVTFLKMKGDNK